MFRVLIVDDEPYIADDLSEYLSGLDHPELEVYKVYSGEDALLFLEKTKVDILVSDINMPIISGMEILEQVRKNWPRCKIIFLTGYAEYNYVHNALVNNVCGYILKTEGKGEILAAINKAVTEIERELQDEQMINLAAASISKAIPILQNEFVTALLQKDKSTLENLSIKTGELDIPLSPEKEVLLLIGKVDFWPAAVDLSTRLETLYRIQAITEQYIAAYCKVLPAIYDRNILIWLIQPFSETASWERQVVFVKESLASIQASGKKLIGSTISFCLSSKPKSWEMLAGQFTILNFLLERESGYVKEAILLDTSLSPQELDFINRSESERHKAGHYKKNFALLENYLETNQKHEFMKLYDTLLHYNAEQPPTGYLKLEIQLSMALLLVNYFNKWGLPDSPIEELLHQIPEFRIPGSHRPGIHENYRKAAEMIFHRRAKEQEARSGNAIKFLQKYINEHLNDDLSLIKLADLVYLHPNYLSRLYRQETGSTLSDYINEARLELAKKLLVTTDMKVLEIAAITGFESTPYFTRFFKKKTGSTPQAYRESFCK